MIRLFRLRLVQKPTVAIRQTFATTVLGSVYRATYRIADGSAGETVQDGTPLGRYRLLELMGRGEMGETWRAFDAVTQREVAVTVLPTQDVDPAHAPQSGIVVEYPLYWPNVPLPTDPTHDEPTHDDTNPPGVKKSRKRRLIALSGAAAIAVTAAIVAAIVLLGPSGHGGAPHASSARTSAVPLANTGPFTGIFKVHMSEAVLKDGDPATDAEAQAYTETWQLRSACSANGCVATASVGGSFTDIAQLPDPTQLDSRVVSPAEALRGRYDVQTI